MLTRCWTLTNSVTIMAGMMAANIAQTGNRSSDGPSGLTMRLRSCDNLCSELMGNCAVILSDIIWITTQTINEIGTANLLIILLIYIIKCALNKYLKTYHVRSNFQMPILYLETVWYFQNHNFKMTD